MFWNVPGCSGMFHVPGFIDAQIYCTMCHVTKQRLLTMHDRVALECFFFPFFLFFSPHEMFNSLCLFFCLFVCLFVFLIGKRVSRKELFKLTKFRLLILVKKIYFWRKWNETCYAFRTLPDPVFFHQNLFFPHPGTSYPGTPYHVDRVSGPAFSSPPYSGCAALAATDEFQNETKRKELYACHYRLVGETTL